MAGSSPIRRASPGMSWAASLGKESTSLALERGNSWKGRRMTYRATARRRERWRSMATVYSGYWVRTTISRDLSKIKFH